MRHAPALLRFACTLLAAALSIPAAGCAPASTAAPAPPSCRDLTPDRPAGLPHHLRGERQLMGTSFQVRVATPDLSGGCAAIEAAFAEVAREEALFSEYRPTSEISAINGAAGEAPVQVDAEVFGLLQRSLWASRVTRGAFDMTFASCGGL
jgi:thiamine biosynthesis lipoprotein ApbE